MSGGEAAARIEHHSYRMRAGDPAGGQLRIVAFHGAGANDDRIAQCAHPVQVRQVLGAVDVTGRAVRGGDAPIQALAEMRHRQRSAPTSQGDRQIKIQ